MSSDNIPARRTCLRCGLDLPAGSFRFKDKAAGVRHRTCKGCQRAYFQKRYAENRDLYIGRATASNRWLRDEAREFIACLKSRPCTDCGGTFPVEAMQFDHRTPADKLNEVGWFRTARTKLARELAKCDVVCANCHAIRTANRRASAS